MLRLALVIAVLVASVVADARAAQSGELTAILSSLAERTQQYYDRFISIICTETVHLQELRFNLTPLGKPRVTVYELSVSANPRSKDKTDFQVGRILQMVNGRLARKHQTPACTDPKTGTPEPLAFLLATNQAGFRFALAPSAEDGPPGTRVLEYVEVPAERVQVRWSGNCFEAEGGGQKGRVWFDPATFDVLQVEIRLSKPFLIPMPAGYIGLVPAVRVERSEATIKFSRVNFTQPDETVLLPESIATLQVLRGVPSMRMTQTLTNFRRFLAESSIF